MRLKVVFMLPLLVLFLNKFRPSITKYIETGLCLCIVSHFTVYLFQTKNLRQSVLWALYVIFINLTVINLYWQYIKCQERQEKSRKYYLQI